MCYSNPAVPLPRTNEPLRVARNGCSRTNYKKGNRHAVRNRNQRFVRLGTIQFYTIGPNTAKQPQRRRQECNNLSTQGFTLSKTFVFEKLPAACPLSPFSCLSISQNCLL